MAIATSKTLRNRAKNTYPKQLMIGPSKAAKELKAKLLSKLNQFIKRPVEKALVQTSRLVFRPEVGRTYSSLEKARLAQTSGKPRPQVMAMLRRIEQIPNQLYSERERNRTNYQSVIFNPLARIKTLRAQFQTDYEQEFLLLKERATGALTAIPLTRRVEISKEKYEYKVVRGEEIPSQAAISRKPREAPMYKPEKRERQIRRVELPTDITALDTIAAYNMLGSDRQLDAPDTNPDYAKEIEDMMTDPRIQEEFKAALSIISELGEEEIRASRNRFIDFLKGTGYIISINVGPNIDMYQEMVFIDQRGVLLRNPSASYNAPLKYPGAITVNIIERTGTAQYTRQAIADYMVSEIYKDNTDEINQIRARLEHIGRVSLLMTSSNDEINNFLSTLRSPPTGNYRTGDPAIVGIGVYVNVGQ